MKLYPTHNGIGPASLLAIVLAFGGWNSTAQEKTWTIEKRIVPLPAAASDELRASIGALPQPNVSESQNAPMPASDEEWEAHIKQRDALTAFPLASLAKLYSVSIQPKIIEGVKTYVVQPEKTSPKHEGRVFLHLHGGGYAYGGGDNAPLEAAIISGRIGMTAISVDYRMPPHHPFPAAVEDSVAVYKSLLGSYPAKSIVIGGTSAGAGLTLATVHKLIDLGVEVPGAIYLGTPWADLTVTGDSMYTNEGLDRILVSSKGIVSALAKLYAGGEELKHPLISPVYGNFDGFPPSLLITGTRDMFLSDTARTHRKLRAAGVPADLHVFEGMSHAGYLVAANSPESMEAVQELNLFLDRHMK